MIFHILVNDTILVKKGYRYMGNRYLWFNYICERPLKTQSLDHQAPHRLTMALAAEALEG